MPLPFIPLILTPLVFAVAKKVADKAQAEADATKAPDPAAEIPEVSPDPTPSPASEEPTAEPIVLEAALPLFPLTASSATVAKSTVLSIATVLVRMNSKKLAVRRSAWSTLRVMLATPAALSADSGNISAASRIRLSGLRRSWETPANSSARSRSLRCRRSASRR